MDIILAAALAICAEEPEKCTVVELEKVTIVSVCDIQPESEARPLSFSANLPYGLYQFQLSPKCTNY